MRDGCLVGFLITSILVTFAIEAHAQAGGAGTPDLLSSRGSAETKIGMDALGNAVAVWTDHRSGNPFGDLFAGQFAVATRQWSSSMVSPYKTLAWDLAVDGRGNAIAIGVYRALVADIFDAYRYDRATARWELQSIPTASHKSGALVAMNVSGSATVCWNHPNTSVHCSRYTPSNGVWSAGVQVGFSTRLGGVAMDAAGGAHVVWAVGSNVRTARFDPDTAVWSAPHDLAVGLAASPMPDPRVAVNDAGDAVATWTRGSVLEASRYSPGIGWSPPVPLSVDGTANASARAAVDPTGAITVAWAHEAPAARTIQVSRFIGGAWTTPRDVSRPEASASGPTAIAADASGNVHLVWRQVLDSRTHVVAAIYTATTDQWTGPADLSGPAGNVSGPDVAVDSSGNAISIWAQDLTVRSLRWSTTPGPPTISGVSTGAGGLSVGFVISSTGPTPNATGLEYSLDGGSTWAAPNSSPLVSPLTIAALTDGVTYDVRLRAINGAGAGRATDQLLVKSGTDIAPRDLRVVARSGNTLTFAWSAPAAGVLPSAYVLEGGVVPGQTLGTLSVAGPHTNATVTMPTGVFYVRVTGLSLLGRGATSNEIQVAVNTAQPPAAPSNLLGTANGSDLQLSWTNVFSGGIPTRLTLQVSGAVTTSLPLPVGETLAFSGVPPGTYTLALTASNAVGTSAPSAPVTLTFPAACAGPPAAPTNVSVGVSGAIATLAWDPPAAGPAISGYTIQVSGAFNGALSVTSRIFTAPAAPGSYVVRIAAANACGTGASTAPVTVVVP